MKNSSLSPSEFYQFLDAYETGHVIVEVLSVARSGMSRRLAFYVPDEDGLPTPVTNIVAELCGLHCKQDAHHKPYVFVKGCGMDMIFYTLYIVGQKLALRGFIDRRDVSTLASHYRQSQ